MWRHSRFVAIRCTHPKCTCDCFSPSKSQVRICQGCKHGWVAHALDKLMTSHPFANLGGQTEALSASIVFDVASLILYGCQAIPIRLKICLDRLFSTLEHAEVNQVLHGFGWSYEDYARGYIVQDPTGRVLEKWTITTRSEEDIVLQQFLRFAESRTVAQEILLNETKNCPDLTQTSPTKADSDIRKFIERNNLSIMQSYNLAVRRAFDSPQSLFSAMNAFPAHLNVAAAAAAAQQFGRAFPPGLSVPAMAQSMSARKESTKIEPSTPESMPIPSTPTRRLSEPYDLTKKSPESPSASQSPGSSATSVPTFSNAQNPQMSSELKTPEYKPGLPVNGHDNLSSAGSQNLMRNAPSPSSSLHKSWPFNSPSFGQTVFVTASGKKRVLCTACNKTFCDKGALKIHYSAVHLKEMHKCSIPGCNMMFSSRRSRNRHSANPNPKLHTPQTRRPRERCDEAQSQMMGHMSLPLNNRNQNDEEEGSNFFIGSSSDSKLMASLPQDYHGLNDSTPTPSEEDQRDDDCMSDLGMEIDMSPSVSQVAEVKKESLMYRSNKRKRLMPTRVTTTTELNKIGSNLIADPSFARESPVDDPTMNLCDDPYLRQSEEAEPGEVRRPERYADSGSEDAESQTEPGEVVRRNFEKIESQQHDDKPLRSVPKYEKNQTSPMQALFSSFLPTNDNQSSFWSKLISRNTQSEENTEDRHSEDLSDDTASTDSRSPDVNQLDIPLNPDNPRLCAMCDKEFPNIFTVRLHYQNVHLKAQYMCTVEGCHATFSSKNSRDRHSVNMDLHSKLVENNPNALAQLEENCKKMESDLHPNEGEQLQQQKSEFKCEACEKRFTSNEALVKHVTIIHQGQKSLFPDQSGYTSPLSSVKCNTTIVA